MNSAGSITDLIEKAKAGDSAAFDDIFELAYEDLRELARARLRSSGRNVVLDTTSLVHESFLRLAHVERLNASSRAHFLNYAGRVMRSVIVDFARERLAQRRGGGAVHVTLDTEVSDSTGAGEEEVIRVHEALEELGRHDEKLVRVVEMRYFGGLTESEIAESLGIHVRTVRRHWEKARLLLADALNLA